jgi:uncharacterized membrane protein (DUF485 family)
MEQRSPNEGFTERLSTAGGDRLRRLRFVIPLAVFFLVWYFAFVIVAAYLPDFMAQKVFGSVNLGIILGLGQFVTTFAITIWYVLFSNRVLDPLGVELRAELEQQAAA